MECKKCKKSEYLKIITPHNKKGCWLICENCNWEIQLPYNKTTEIMYYVYQVYINCLSHGVTYGGLELKDVKKYALEICDRVIASRYDKEVSRR